MSTVDHHQAPETTDSCGNPTMVSHRPTATEDCCIAEPATAARATRATQTSAGSPRCPDRMADDNRLAWTEDELGHDAAGAGGDAFPLLRQHA